MIDELLQQLPLYGKLIGQAAGFKIGRDVYINSTRLGDPSLVSFEDGAVLDKGCMLLTHTVHYSRLAGHSIKFAAISVDKDMQVGVRAVVAMDSHIASGQSVPAGSLHLNLSEVSRTEQNRTEQDRQNRTEQNRTEQNRTEQNSDGDAQTLN